MDWEMNEAEKAGKKWGKRNASKKTNRNKSRAAALSSTRPDVQQEARNGHPLLLYGRAEAADAEGRPSFHVLSAGHGNKETERVGLFPVFLFFLLFFLLSQERV